MYVLAQKMHTHPKIPKFTPTTTLHDATLNLSNLRHSERFEPMSLRTVQTYVTLKGSNLRHFEPFKPTSL